jgi:hypothetical protein
MQRRRRSVNPLTPRPSKRRACPPRACAPRTSPGISAGCRCGARSSATRRRSSALALSPRSRFIAGPSTTRRAATGPPGSPSSARCATRCGAQLEGFVAAEQARPDRGEAGSPVSDTSPRCPRRSGHLRASVHNSAPRSHRARRRHRNLGASAQTWFAPGCNQISFDPSSAAARSRPEAPASLRGSRAHQQHHGPEVAVALIGPLPDHGAAIRFQLRAPESLVEARSATRPRPRLATFVSRHRRIAPDSSATAR